MINSVEYPVCLLLRFQNNLSMANEAYWQTSLNTGNTQAHSQSWNIPHLSNKQQPDICAALFFKVNILRKDWRNLHLMHANLWYFRSGSLPQKEHSCPQTYSCTWVGLRPPSEQRICVRQAHPWPGCGPDYNKISSTAYSFTKSVHWVPVICQAWVMCQQLRAEHGGRVLPVEICRDLPVHLTRLRH